MAKRKNFDYRQAKKILNSYHKFSFEMPRKGKDFTPQQKSAITRVFNRIGDAIMRVQEGEYKFIKGEKLKDGMNTNKGTIFHYPKAEVKKDIKYKRYKVKPIKIGFGVRREMLFIFPKPVSQSIERIKNFVAYLEKKYKPDYIRWAYKNMRTSEVYDPETYEKYLTVAQMSDEIHAIAYKERIGVYLGWRPDIE